MGPEDGKQIPVATHNRGELSLLEVPARIAEFGINTLELCHFHIPSLDKGYLNELRGALEAADVELFSLLIDHGDITHPEYADQDLVWIGKWIETAGMHRCHLCSRNCWKSSSLRRSTGDEPKWTTKIGRVRRGKRHPFNDRELVLRPLNPRKRIDAA